MQELRALEYNALTDVIRDFALLLCLLGNPVTRADSSWCALHLLSAETDGLAITAVGHCGR